ncbi:MAG: hypothetical protein LUG93_08500 [Lachnospiraceae bacterium]|nr:hypothetical protein [Lachnospiraceae bacterium]
MEGMRKRFLLFAMLFTLLIGAGSVKASAATVNVVKTATVVSGGEWVTKTTGRKYKYEDGTYAKNIWLNIGGSIYYFDSKGICQTGWFTYNDNYYYASSTGKLYVSKWKTTKNYKYYLRANGTRGTSQWLKIEGKYYYFNAKGRLVTSSIFAVNGKYYCVDGNGVRVTSSLVKKNGKTYYFGEDGVRLKSSWLTLNGKTYYFNSSGVRVEGTLKKISGKYYYFKSNGALLKSSWKTISGKTYYFNSSGVRVQSKWKKISGNYYYFDSNGVMLTSQWVGDYYVDENGVRLTDCVVDGYKLDSTGKKGEYTGKYIFVGDSRIVGMASAVSDSNTIFIGKVGMGLSWLKSTASNTLATYLNKDSTAKVIFAFGVNDLYNISSYITYYNTLIAKYPDTEFYMMAVNPVNETTAKKYGYSVTNSQIAAFNKKLKAAFSSIYVDTYTYLNSNGFGTSDGIHYTSATYKKIYSYVISAVS